MPTAIESEVISREIESLDRKKTLLESEIRERKSRINDVNLQISTLEKVLAEIRRRQSPGEVPINESEGTGDDRFTGMSATAAIVEALREKPRTKIELMDLLADQVDTTAANRRKLIGSSTDQLLRNGRVQRDESGRHYLIEEAEE